MKLFSDNKVTAEIVADLLNSEAFIQTARWETFMGLEDVDNKDATIEFIQTTFPDSIVVECSDYTFTVLGKKSYKQGKLYKVNDSFFEVGITYDSKVRVTPVEVHISKSIDTYTLSDKNITVSDFRVRNQFQEAFEKYRNELVGDFSSIHFLNSLDFCRVIGYIGDNEYRIAMLESGDAYNFAVDEHELHLTEVILMKHFFTDISAEAFESTSFIEWDGEKWKKAE